MRYWGFFAAKLIAAGAILRVAWVLVQMSLHRPVVFVDIANEPFGHDLTYTAVMMVYALFATGLIWLAIWDQRYRCRTCLRRLRMPLTTGSWTNRFLIGRPRTEYICLYGHGTLRVAEEQIDGVERPGWEPHDDIWRELESFEETRK